MPDYLDTSALIKLVRSEAESPALRRELAGRELLSSTLLSVEGGRAARRYGELATKRARAALTAVTLLPLDQPILETAAELGPAELRSLDALHLATVLSLGEDLERLYCYDARLGDAAEAFGYRGLQASLKPSAASRGLLVGWCWGLGGLVLSVCGGCGRRSRRSVYAPSAGT